MNLKTGDKVAFRNDKLNGVVKEILSPDKIIVALEDGFDVTVSEKELIKAGDASKAFEKYFAKQEQAQQEIKNENAAESYLSRYGNAGQISLITLPAIHNQVQNGPVIFRIENNTDYDLLTVLTMVAGQKHKIIFAGKTAAYNFVSTPEFKRNDLSAYSNLHLEIIFYKEAEFEKRKPVSTDIAIQLPEWNLSNPLIKGVNSFARIQPVTEIGEQKIDLDKLIENFNSRESKQFLKKNNSTQQFDIELEVDLHWDAIEGKSDLIDEKEILQLQLKHFHHEMNQALNKKVTRIIFIHGVGEGVLKNAIDSELKNYSGAKSKPANEAKYGKGAVEVLLS